MVYLVFSAKLAPWNEAYSPKLMAQTMGIIVVELTYRLNIFGFLALEALNQYGSDTNTSGNYGFYDQIAALQWVKNNIIYFGGDPNNVVLNGQSSGGFCVSFVNKSIS